MSPDGSTKRPLPEEKLLRLLRGRARREDPTPQAPAVMAPGGAVAVAGSATRRTLSWPRLAVGGLTVVLAAEGLLLVGLLARPLPAVVRPAVHRAEDASPEVPASPQPLELPSLAASASSAAFTAPVGRAAETGRARPSHTAHALGTRLKLLGIVAGDPPQAIIEDEETKRSYFVTVGQMVVEGAVLDEVGQNQVILDLHGEKITLVL